MCRDSLKKSQDQYESVATTLKQLDQPGVRERVLQVVRVLLEELGSLGALAELSVRSNLDRDLGLGSLERVELLTRLEQEFDLQLPDTLTAEASTPEELIQAILAAPGSAANSDEQMLALKETLATPSKPSDVADSLVEKAETLVEVIRHRGTHNAAQPHLLITEDDEHGEHHYTLTFGDLYSAGQKCAEELARRGVPAGGRVSLMLPTSRQFFICYAGILLAGAVPVPIYPPFRADRIEEYAERQSAILNNAGVCLLITFKRAEAVAKLLKPRVKSLLGVVEASKLLEAAEKAPPPAPGALPTFLSGSRVRKGEDIALLQYTSGSTGDPKGVTLTNANLLATMRAIGKAVELSPSEVGISWLPLYHDMGLIGAWLTLLLHGTPLVVMSPLAFLTRPERWLQAISKHKGTITAAPNFAYELCVRKVSDKAMEGVDLSSMKASLNGAEPVNPETMERFYQRFGKYRFRREAMMPVYGLAEASLAATMTPVMRGPIVDRVDRETFATQGKAVPTESMGDETISFVSSGIAVVQHEAKIVDGDGNEVEDRTEGYLWFRGPSVTTGYYKNAEATTKLFPAGQAEGTDSYAWMNTGDRAYRADGEYYVTGRVKDIIIKGGRNLYPHEVEELAARAEGTRKGCVVAFGLKDEANGTEKLVIVAESRASDASEPRNDCSRDQREGRARPGIAAGSRRTNPTREHSKDVERKIAARRNKTIVCGGNLGRVKAASMAADCAFGIWDVCKRGLSRGFYRIWQGA